MSLSLYFCISVFLYFCILHIYPNKLLIDYMELISTISGDEHVQSYGPSLTITSCPSCTEQPWRTRPWWWWRYPVLPSGDCSGGRYSDETPPPPPARPVHLPLYRQDSPCCPHHTWMNTKITNLKITKAHEPASMCSDE